MKYLVDANTLSEPTRPQPDARVLERLTRYEADIAMAATAFHEMVFGALRLPKSKKRTALVAYLQDLEATFPTLPYSRDAARWHAEERARLFRKTPSFTDGQIAAVAAVHDLILVTRNVVHFKPFSVTVENWFD